MGDVFKNWLFIDQLKIMGYGESDTSGCWMKFQLTPELLEVVRGRKGEMVEVAARLIDNSGEYVPPARKAKTLKEVPVRFETKTDPETGEKETVAHIDVGRHGKYWQHLIRHGVFNAPPVLEAIGSDEDFRHWIHKQPSCLSKDADWDEMEGDRKSVV